MPPHSDSEFAEILTEAVDHGLLFLGESARKSIYFHLKKSYGFTKEHFLDNIEVLVKGLQTIFGTGASVIEEAILKSLYSKLQLNLKEKKGFKFIDYIHEARTVWLANSARAESGKMALQAIQ